MSGASGCIHCLKLVIKLRKFRSLEGYLKHQLALPTLKGQCVDMYLSSGFTTCSLLLKQSFKLSVKNRVSYFGNILRPFCAIALLYMKNSRCTVPHSLRKECKLMFLVSRQHLPLSNPANTDVLPDGGVILTQKCSHGKTSWVSPITTGTSSSKRAESWRGSTFGWAEQGAA